MNRKKEIEDIAKYGEFVSSYFEWNTLEGQKKRARKLANISKKDKKNISQNIHKWIIDKNKNSDIILP